MLVPVRLAQRRLFKRVQDSRRGYRYATARQDRDLSVLIVEYASILQRSLAGVDPQLQRNKVANLRLAAARIDGVLIRPGETMSFWRLVGPATARGGYAEGLVLRDGRAASGVGGGLCQISNMLHWLVLHSDLKVVERHRHSFDPFPDSDRVVPFGTGATLLAGIYDLKLGNPTAITYQIRLSLSATHLVGQLRAGQEPPARYEIVERDHRFTLEGDQVFRSNRIVRRTLAAHAQSAPAGPVNGAPAGAGGPVEVTLFSNHARVGYPVDADQID